ncbi:hypothetical protein [Corallibacter sp.]|uniref:hypothetical protein n=1 Tax=Corallibacter sp. TaxID=2038084 RepID=UPI003A93DBEA
MKLHYYKPSPKMSNFGDELNVPIWNHFFSNYLSSDSNIVFLGIGTVLRVIKKKYSNSEKVIVFGSGSHSSNIDLPSNVEIKFVRGPLSAQALTNKKVPYITDPAIIIPLVFPCKGKTKKHKFSYMPHYSVDNDNIRKAIEGLGIHYISPKDEWKSIIIQINQTNVLLSEAMHGAIVADAYRIPWLPVYTYKSFNFFKWKDWALSQKINLKFFKLIRIYESDSVFKLFVKKKILAYKLSRIKKNKPFLSTQDVHQINTKKIIKAIEELKTSELFDKINFN